MFLGYQNNKIVAYTKYLLDPTFYIFDKVVETEDVYVLDGDEYVLYDDNYKAKQLELLRTEKLNEAVVKCSEKRYNQTFTVELQGQECEFDTTEQTQSDLQTAAIVTATGATYDNWVTNNGVVLNLTAEDIQSVFAVFFSLISPLYTKQLEYIEQINACETVEELEAIVINYDDEAVDPEEPTEEINEEQTEATEEVTEENSETETEEETEETEE